ncbi:MAG: diguanylate cyclase [Lachnospiraceae bacterium]|nr:diguanylate cyclase [Lachnospiraceae bacterium]
MKSIQTKILILILAVIILCTFVVGGNSILFVETSSNKSSAQIMNLICQEEGRKIDHIFHSIEQSVKILAYNAVREEDTIGRLATEKDVQKYLDELRPVVLATAESAEGAVAAYIHLNPKLASSDAGLFYAKRELYGAFKEQQPTDFSKIKKEENLQWYIKPATEGKASWIEPYYNGKSEGLVMTYVTPIYEKHVLIGVAGMDVHLSTLTKMVDNIKAYKTGHAALVNSNHEIIYHANGENEFPISNRIGWDRFMTRVRRGENTTGLFSFEYQGEARKTIFTDLEADIYLMVSAPVSEIDAEKVQLIRGTIMGVVVVSIFCLLISLIVSQGIVEPLKELTKASKQIAEGDLQVSLETKSKDEVGALAVSMQQTVDCLRAYMERISDMAYTDPLTGVKSKAAYDEQVKQINENIQTGFAQFGMVMFDLNNLKQINDTYGHEAGDAYIINGCRVICNTFKHSPIFRIGGDEFVAILSGRDLLHADALLDEFYEKMKQEQKNSDFGGELISIAAGFSSYDEEKDKELQDVFNRADIRMYQNKEAIKKGMTPVKIE